MPCCESPALEQARWRVEPSTLVSAHTGAISRIHRSCRLPARRSLRLCARCSSLLGAHARSESLIEMAGRRERVALLQMALVLVALWPLGRTSAGIDPHLQFMTWYAAHSPLSLRPFPQTTRTSPRGAGTAASRPSSTRSRTCASTPTTPCCSRRARWACVG
jgi:hypothetical protein